MKLKYVKIIDNAGEKEAVLNLFGHIGNDINGDTFANELKWLENQNNITSCKIKINSVGGSVFQGYSILAGMEALKDKGKKIKTECVGVAYSMAGIILTAGQERSIYDYGTVMIHDPFFRNGQEPQTTGEESLVENIKNSLTSILVSNTKLSEETTKEYMQNETTFNSKEAKRNGFVDNIQKTGRNVKKIQNITDSMELMVACSDMYNENLIIKNVNKMEKVSKLLGLNAEANEDAIFNAVSELKEKTIESKTLLDEKNVLTSKVEQLINEVNTLKEEASKKDAEILVNEAIKGGKIKADAKETWVENAVSNFEGTKKLIDGLNVVPDSINNSLETDVKGEKALAMKYEKMLTETPEMLDTLDESELSKMEDAYAKLNKVDVETIN